MSMRISNTIIATVDVFTNASPAYKNGASMQPTIDLVCNPATDAWRYNIYNTGLMDPLYVPVSPQQLNPAIGAARLNVSKPKALASSNDHIIFFINLRVFFVVL